MQTGTGLSGSTAWNNSVRSRLYLERQKGKNAEPDEDPDARVLRRMKANYAGINDEIRCRWVNGVLVPEESGGWLDAKARDGQAEQVFLAIMRRLAQQGMDVSPNPSRAFAPALFGRRDDAEGLKPRDFERAMHRLLTAGKLRVDEDGPPSKRRKRLVLA